MLFSQDRGAMRRFFIETWQLRLAGRPLEPLQQLLAEVIAEHPEYHALLADEDALAREFTPEQGSVNPFLHMAMHLSVREQVGAGRPEGIGELYLAACARTGDRHEVEHHFMECLGQALWQAQRNGAMPDEMSYMECLRRIG